MYENFILIAMTYLIVKHFIWDFTSLQTPWMFMNKGTYGHWGGIAHAWLHAAASAPIFLWAMTQSDWHAPSMWHGLEQVEMVAAVVVFEFLVHYHMDWFKMWFGRRQGWSDYVRETTVDYVDGCLPDAPGVATTHRPHLAIYHNDWFTALGVDQLVHYLTYVAMITAWVV